VKQEVGTKKVFLKTMKDTPAIYMSWKIVFILAALKKFYKPQNRGVSNHFASLMQNIKYAAGSVVVSFIFIHNGSSNYNY
jgi:hypothetical protein